MRRETRRSPRASAMRSSYPGALRPSAHPLWRVNRPRHGSGVNNPGAGTAPQMGNPPEDLTAPSNEVAAHVVEARRTTAAAGEAVIGQLILGQ
jgi:hypothetical protein